MILRKLFLTAFLNGLVLLSSLAQQPRLVLPIGHTNIVNSVFFSPDGKRVVSASWDKSVKLWDVNTGLLLANLEGHKKDVYYANFSPDGRKIISISRDASIKIWSAQTGAFLYEIAGSKEDTYSDLVPKFDNAGNRVVIWSADSVIVADVNSGKRIFETGGDGIDFLSAEFTPDGRTLITASIDGSIRVWQLIDGELLREFKTNNISGSIVLGGDSQKIKFFDRTGTLIVLNAESGSIISEVPLESSQPYSFSFSPDEKMVMTLSGTGNTRVYEVLTGKVLADFSHGGINQAIFSPDSRNITLSSGDSIRSYALDGSRLLYGLKAHGSLITQVRYSPDGRLIATSSEDQTVKIWQANSAQLIQELSGHSKAVQDAVISPTGNKVLIVSNDNVARVRKINTGELSIVLNGHTSFVSYGQFSPDEKKIITASYDSTAGIWDANSGELLFRLRGHSGWLQSAVFSQKKKEVLTASNDGTIKIWSSENGALLRTISVSDAGVVYANYLSDHKKILTVPLDSSIQIRDLVDGALLIKIKEFSNYVFSANADPNGYRIVSASGEDPVRIWNSNNGKLLLEIDNKGKYAYWANFSSDGKLIITGYSDGSVMIWDSETGQHLKTLTGHSNYINSAKFSTDGKKIITSSADQSNMIWESRTGRLLYSFFFLDTVNSITLLPSGYYQTTRSSAHLLHYVTKDLKVITFEQLDVKFNRPDKVVEAIGNTDTTLIRSYRKAWQKRIKKLGIDTTQFRDGYSVPECDFADRDNISYDQKNGNIRVRIIGLDSIYKLDRFNVWVNEVPVYGQRGISLKKINSNTIDTTIQIILSEGENRIETSITNMNGTESYRMPLIVNYTPAVKQTVITHFIGIGIDQFKDSRRNLQYSSKDIRDLSLKLKEKFGESLIIDTLFNENVTVNNVKALKKKLAQTSVNDKVIVSYSGHGLLSKEYDYYLSTYDINFEKPEQGGLPYEELENLLDSIPARQKLMLIDACHSGEVDKDELVRINKTSDSMHLTKGGITVAYESEGKLGMKNSFELMQNLFVNVGKTTGATIISAAAGTQFALERGDLKNGVFTYCILEAMEKNKTMKISELKKIVGQRVEELTDGLQRPTSRNENISTDWTLW